MDFSRELVTIYYTVPNWNGLYLEMCFTWKRQINVKHGINFCLRNNQYKQLQIARQLFISVFYFEQFRVYVLIIRNGSLKSYNTLNSNDMCKFSSVKLRSTFVIKITYTLIISTCVFFYSWTVDKVC
jgi:hypothetical protein